MHHLLIRFKPGVKKVVLVALSGLMWIGVGGMLCSLAYRWLSVYTGRWLFIFPLLGFIASMFIHHFGFLHLVDKNLDRIANMKGKPCAFSFISWKSYLMVLTMVALGLTLRHSSFPKQYLSVIYIAIGLSLILSSIRYFRFMIYYAE